MNSSQIVLARLSLKTDTAANWSLIDSTFIPLDGELIVYRSDESHSYSRLKVGDGSTTLASLPFIDAGTINGENIPPSDIQPYETRNTFPLIGESNKLYVALDTNKIYCYDSNRYIQLSNFTYTPRYTNTSNITSWDAGGAASFSISNGCLNIRAGSAPYLNYSNISVVADITKE